MRTAWGWARLGRRWSHWLEAAVVKSPVSRRTRFYDSGPVDPSFRALSGRFKLTIRRHKSNKHSLSFYLGAAPDVDAAVARACEGHDSRVQGLLEMKDAHRP